MELAANQKEKERVKSFPQWWRRYYVYVISSILVLIAVLVVLAAKRFWPFGNGVLLNGDFILQGWPFITEFKRKLASGDSLLYTWNVAFGTNFYSILTYGLVNPAVLIYMLIPERFILQASTILYVINMLMLNWSMLYFLTHRPGHHLEQNKLVNMLFSLSYTLCMYFVSNINNWSFLVTAVLFPLIILGLERFVANQGWKLYAVTLALAFIFNYYFAGLFCVFIILYYLTLEFGSFRNFWRKSLKILLVSILSVLLSAGMLIPSAMQVMGQSYTRSEVQPDTWFTTIFDIVKNFFAFNCAIDRGTSSDSYGEVNLYFGLLLLLLGSFYFLNPKIKRKVRGKKLCLVVVYLLSFNLNILNYVMHLFHYPTWFPNRFSLFFTLFAILLAYDAWVSMEETDFRYMTVLRGVVVGLAWVGITIVCFAFAETIKFQFTYYYSIMIFLFYMVAMLFLPYFKRKWGRILAVIGCIELILCFDYAFIYRPSAQMIQDAEHCRQEEMAVLNKGLLEETHGFSRVAETADVLNGVNGGVLFDIKANTIFASSMSETGSFLWYFGISGGGNVLKPYTYTPATLSMLNLQYVLWDGSFGEAWRNGGAYSDTSNLYEHYPVATEQNGIVLYENPTVLSLGYMIDSSARNEFIDAEKQEEEGRQCCDNINAWVETVSGIPDVLEPAELILNHIELVNCEGAVVDSQYYMTQKLRKSDIDSFYTNGSEVLIGNSAEAYDEKETSMMRLDCTASEDGDYFMQIGDDFTAIGHLEKGEKYSVYYYGDDNGTKAVLNEDTGVSGRIQLHRLNEEQWQKAYQILSEQQMQVTEYTSSTLEGTIDVTEAGLLFTSIPYDKNWTLYVDGVETEILPLWRNAFVAVELSEGTHEIRLEYHQRGMVGGIVISVLALGMLIACFVFSKKNRQDWILEKEMEVDYIDTFYPETIPEESEE